MKIVDLFEAANPLKTTKELSFYAKGLIVYATTNDESIIVDYTKEDPWFRDRALSLTGPKNVVGVLQLGKLNSVPDHFTIEAVHVQEDYRKQGIAKNLYSVGVKLAKQKGRDGIASPPDLRKSFLDSFWEKNGRYDEEIEMDVLEK